MPRAPPVDIKPMKKSLIAAVLGAAALAVPAAATADSGHDQGHARGHGHVKPAVVKKAKRVTFVFKGTFGADGTVQVLAGNAHVRKGGFVGRTVTFDFTRTRVAVADTNGDGTADVADVSAGDLVLVKARLAKRTKYGVDAELPVATKLVDKTNAAVDDDAA
jgi:hypothetical protein